MQNELKFFFPTTANKKHLSADRYLPTISLFTHNQHQTKYGHKPSFSCVDLYTSSYDTFIKCPDSSRTIISNKMINKKIGPLIHCKIYNKKLVFSKPKNPNPKKITMLDLPNEIVKGTTSNFNNKYNIFLKKMTRNSSNSDYNACNHNIQKIMILTNSQSAKNINKQELKCDFNFLLFNKDKKIKVNHFRLISM